jgi:hypothetical protein
MLALASAVVPPPPERTLGHARRHDRPPARDRTRPVRGRSTGNTRPVERALSILERILPVAAKLARGVRAVSFVALAAAAVVALALFRDGLPEDGARTLVSVVLAAVLFVPGLVLFAFHRALLQVIELPARLRALPGTGREHAAELARLVRQQEERRSRWTGRPLRAWRLLALGRSSRALLTPYAPLVALLSPPFLIASAVSMLVTPALVLVALVAVAVLA